MTAFKFPHCLPSTNVVYFASSVKFAGIKPYGCSHNIVSTYINSFHAYFIESKVNILEAAGGHCSTFRTSMGVYISKPVNTCMYMFVQQPCGLFSNISHTYIYISRVPSVAQIDSGPFSHSSRGKQLIHDPFRRLSAINSDFAVVSPLP